MSITAVPYSALPRHNLYPAAECVADIAAAAAKLNVKLRRTFLKESPGWHRQIFLSLTTGRYASLIQWEIYPGKVDVELELYRHQFLYKEDLLEMLSLLNVKIEDAECADGGFTWIKPGETLEEILIARRK